MRGSVVAIALVVGLAMSSPPALAAAGDLDPTFGDEGRVVATFGGASAGNDVAIAPDGDLVVAGAVDGMLAVFRFRAGGAVETGFGGGDGVVAVRLGAHQGDEAAAVAIAARGRIVVAGSDSGERIVVARFLPSGVLDGTFSRDGVMRTRADEPFRGASDVAVQPDGRIVVAGTAGVPARSRWAVLRVRPNGRLDGSFGDGGVVRTAFGWSMALGVALQPDGRIVATGYSQSGFAVARYLRDGRLDPSFGGGDGRVGGGPYELPRSAVTTGAIAIDPRGRIVLGGDRDIFRHAVVRLLPDGRFDRSFGRDGFVFVHTGCCEQAVTELAILPTGKILAVGYAGPHESADEAPARFVAFRLGDDGRLDPSWGGDGKVVTRFRGGARARGLAIRPDGRAVLSGEIGLNGNEGVALARYLA